METNKVKDLPRQQAGVVSVYDPSSLLKFLLGASPRSSVFPTCSVKSGVAGDSSRRLLYWAKVRGLRRRRMIDRPLPMVVAICVSSGGIPKLPVDEILITSDGLWGDGHDHPKHRSPWQAVCLQDKEHLDAVTNEGIPLVCGTIGENLTLQGLDVQNLPIGTRLEFEGGVILETTKVRTPCYVLDRVDVRLKEWLKGRCGMYAKVIRPGMLKKKAIVSGVALPV